MTYSDYVIYVDESGDHTLTAIDRDYPVFVLDFCIFRKDSYANVVAPQVQAFKFAHFGHDIVVLHEHEIRKQKPPFVFLKSRDKRDGVTTDVHGNKFRFRPREGLAELAKRFGAE